MDVALQSFARGKVLLLLFVATVFLAPLSAEEKADPVIYPRGNASANGAPAASPTSGVSSTSILAVALLLGAGGWWLWLKRKQGVGGLGGNASLLKVAETRSLGSRQYLVVAEYEGKKFLLGVCPGSIEMLTPLDGAARPTKES